MTNWKDTTLGEVARNVSRRFDFSTKKKVIFVNTGDVLDGKFVHSNYSEKEGLPGQAKKAIKKGDILFSEIRPENKRFALVDFDADDYVVSTKFMVIERKDNIDPNFLYILLTSRETLQEFQITAESRSGTFPQITFDSIANFSIQLPPIEEQKEIAGVLSSLDDKIELLREENKTLEATAQAIFKEWFVNFDFPNAEGKPYKSSGGKMIDSEFGKIPEGWRVGKYQDMVNVVTGKGIRKEDLINQGLYQVLGANGEIGRTDEFLFDEDLILTGRVGTLGTIYISQGKVWISDNVLISKPKAVENFYFAYFHLKRFNFEGLNRGSTQPLVTQTDLKNVDIVLPIKEMLEHWHTLCADVFIKISNNNSQIQTLSTLRDTLLPKLMSGKLLIS